MNRPRTTRSKAVIPHARQSQQRSRLAEWAPLNAVFHTPMPGTCGGLGLSKGAKIGIVVGIALAVTVFAFAVGFNSAGY